MITDIEFYMKHSIFDAIQIYWLLHAKYTDHLIFKKDLYNVIQKVEVGQKKVIKNDTANFLHYLYKKKART